MKNLLDFYFVTGLVTSLKTNARGNYMINDSRRTLNFGYNVLNLLREVKTVGGEWNGFASL